MIKGDYEWIKDLASRNMCAAHKTQLEVAWDEKLSAHYLRCGTCGPTDAITRFMTYTEEYRAGGDVPGVIEDNIKKSERSKLMQQTKQVIPFELAGVPTTDLGTGEILVPEVVQGLVDYARKYHLDPTRGHVVLMYGKPYIGLDGYLFHANQVNIPYQLKSRPLTKEERKAFKLGEDDHAWWTDVTMLPAGSLFSGIGIVTQDEMTATAKNKPEQLRAPVVAAHPWQLAQKRAEWQAMRRAFPIGETQERKEV